MENFHTYSMSFNVNRICKSCTIPKLNHICDSDPPTPQIIGVISLSFIMVPTYSKFQTHPDILACV